MSHTIAEHMEMMADPTKWPMLALPLKKRAGLKVGVLLPHKGKPPFVVIEENIGILREMTKEELEKVKHLEYDSIKEIMDAGWMVD